MQVFHEEEDLQHTPPPPYTLIDDNNIHNSEINNFNNPHHFVLDVDNNGPQVRQDSSYPVTEGLRDADSATVYLPPPVLYNNNNNDLNRYAHLQPSNHNNVNFVPRNFADDNYRSSSKCPRIYP
nr:5168_t:CDS:2 [Entrophospora candida]